MDAFQQRPVGQTGVRITRLGFGGSQLGSMFVDVDDGDARTILDAAYDAGIRYFDTAPFYGHGLSEERIGRALRERPGNDFVTSTKVGRVLTPSEDSSQVRGYDSRFDYSYDGVLRSYEDSLRRLGMDRVDLLLVHDLDTVMHPDAESLDSHFARLRDGGVRALEELRASGAIRGIGAGINTAGMVRRFLDEFDIDFFILATPYTLLDQESLDDDLPCCVERGVSIVLGAPFSSGILATGASPQASYRYGPADERVVDRVRRIEAVCARHGVELRSAALQFPFGHQSVVSTIPGVTSPEQVHDNVLKMQTPIPSELWEELLAERLLRGDAPVPRGDGG